MVESLRRQPGELSRARRASSSGWASNAASQPGTYPLTAAYADDGNNHASTSNSLSVTLLSAADMNFRYGFEAALIDCPIE